MQLLSKKKKSFLLLLLLPNAIYAHLFLSIPSLPTDLAFIYPLCVRRRAHVRSPLLD